MVARREESGAFKTILRLQFPPNWNAGARPHIPHRGAKREHSVPSVRTRTALQVKSRPSVWVCVFFLTTEMQVIHHGGQLGSDSFFSMTQLSHAL